MDDRGYWVEEQKEALVEALLSIDRMEVKSILTRSLPEVSPIMLIEKLISPALERIGLEWEQGRLSLSQVYMSGRICEEVIDQILPPGRSAARRQPKMAIAVLEDYHLLGKRIVYSIMRANGYDLLDYGRMSVDELVEIVTQERIEILLISVLMLPSALRVKQLRERLYAKGLGTKIVVGGAPFRFDDQLWQEVGADACGKAASDVLAIVRRLVGDSV